MSGELDAAGEPVLRAAISEGIEAAPQTVVVDLLPVTFVDLTIACMLAAAQRHASARDTDFVIVTNPAIRRQLRRIADVADARAAGQAMPVFT